jgi:hypothetical protein
MFSLKASQQQFTNSSNWSADSAGKYLSLKSTLIRSSAKILSCVNLWHCFIFSSSPKLFLKPSKIVICGVGSELYAATTRHQWLC